MEKKLHLPRKEKKVFKRFVNRSFLEYDQKSYNYYKLHFKNK
jgi:hypothetical protein